MNLRPARDLYRETLSQKQRKDGKEGAIEEEERGVRKDKSGREEYRMIIQGLQEAVWGGERHFGSQF